MAKTVPARSDIWRFLSVPYYSWVEKIFVDLRRFPALHSWKIRHCVGVSVCVCLCGHYLSLFLWKVAHVRDLDVVPVRLGAANLKNRRNERADRCSASRRASPPRTCCTCTADGLLQRHLALHLEADVPSLEREVKLVHSLATLITYFPDCPVGQTLSDVRADHRRILSLDRTLKHSCITRRNAQLLIGHEFVLDGIKPDGHFGIDDLAERAEKILSYSGASTDRPNFRGTNPWQSLRRRTAVSALRPTFPW